METRKNRMFICLVRMKKTFAEGSCHLIVKQLDTFYIFIRLEKMKVLVANQQCIQALSFIWKKAGIPIRAEWHSIPKTGEIICVLAGSSKAQNTTDCRAQSKQDEFV